MHDGHSTDVLFKRWAARSANTRRVADFREGLRHLGREWFLEQCGDVLPALLPHASDAAAELRATLRAHELALRGRVEIVLRHAADQRKKAGERR